MESHHNLKSPQYPDRPIILSPPPLEQPQISSNPQAPFHQERQQSVGYNLQHEFETLTADLDLDLKNKDKDFRGISSSTTNATSSTGLGHSLLASSASKYGFSSDFIGRSATPNALLRDNPISPVPSSSSVSNGIGSLLNSTNSTSNFLPPLASIPNRPQSVNDFSNFFNGQQQQLVQQQQQRHSNNFFQDLLIFSNWIENLSPQDSITMIEYLCNNLPLDILLTFKTKLDNRLTHHSQVPQTQRQNPYVVVSPYQQPLQQPELFNEMENLSLNDNNRQSNNNQPQLHQPKPKLNSYRNGQYLFIDSKNQRPKSADPSLNNSLRFNHQQQFERRSPTSHLFEKTNFLQLAAANSNSPSLQQSQSNNTDDTLDMTVHAALKLGALATINSRVALDSNRKNHGHSHSNNYYQQQNSQNRYHLATNAIAFEESMNRATNSSSVPASNQRQGAVGNNNPKSPTLNYKNRKVNSPEQLKNENSSSDSPQLSSSTQTQSASNSSMPADISNPELLNNIPAWLKLLRLHKYTEFLKDIPWIELVEFNDQQLEEKGVKALGARRKLLKAFDVVKKSI